MFTTHITPATITCIINEFITVDAINEINVSATQRSSIIHRYNEHVGEYTTKDIVDMFGDAFVETWHMVANQHFASWVAKTSFTNINQQSSNARYMNSLCFGLCGLILEFAVIYFKLSPYIYIVVVVCSYLCIVEFLQGLLLSSTGPVPR
jgi:hypothetical protein